VIDILDHAWFAIGATAATRFTVLSAWRAMETAIAEHGAPRQLIGDSGQQFSSATGTSPRNSVLPLLKPPLSTLEVI
jgi:hypothetical protein